MRRKEKREFWDVLFPETSKKVQGRKSLGLVHSAIDVDKATGKTQLKYYASHADINESAVDIEDLQTGRSINDTLLKNFVYGFQILLAASSVLVLFLSETSIELSHVLGGDPTDIEVWLGAAPALFIFLCATAIWFNLRVHFNDMNTDWVDAIKGIVGVDMAALIGKKSAGGFEPGAIANCMLIFRRFIKWRRYMNFFEPLLAVLVAGQAAAMVWYLGFQRVGVSQIEMYLLMFCVGLQVATYLRVSFLRWYWTKWRDPTVQLCLAFASLDRQLWVAKHPAAQGGKSNSAGERLSSMEDGGWTEEPAGIPH